VTRSPEVAKLCLSPVQTERVDAEVLSGGVTLTTAFWPFIVKSNRLKLTSLMRCISKLVDARVQFVFALCDHNLDFLPEA